MFQLIFLILFRMWLKTSWKPSNPCASNITILKRPQTWYEWFLGLSSESRPESMLWSIYVPADERCSPKKLKELKSKAVQAFVYFVVPELKSLLEENLSDDTFNSFQEIFNLFSPNRDRKVVGSFKDTIKNTLVPQLANAITHHASKKSPLRYPLPQIISGNLTFHFTYYS